jgi:hypothetical protein
MAYESTIFKTLYNTVAGVGNVKANIKGSGTVELMVTYLGQSHYMKLMNVLHIPTNRNNLLSLGRLDSAGGSYRSANGKLILCLADHTPIAAGYKVSNNLYKMHVNVYKDTPK